MLFAMLLRRRTRIRITLGAGVARREARPGPAPVRDERSCQTPNYQAVLGNLAVSPAPTLLLLIMIFFPEVSMWLVDVLFPPRLE
jgi:hypothetical protein